MTHTDFINGAYAKVEEGSRFTVNFEKRTFRLDGKLVDLSGVTVKPVREKVMINRLLGLYDDYKHSIPSERSESHRRRYFKALPEEKLSDEDFLYGEPREASRCRLELYLLLMIISGHFYWHKEWGSWFRVYGEDKDFVILRKWVEPQAKEQANA